MRFFIQNAYSYEAAREDVLNEGYFDIILKDATKMWKRAGKPEPGSLQFEDFASKDTEHELKDYPGVGAVITYDPGKENTLKNPFTVDAIINKNVRKYESIYLLLVQNEDGTEQILERVRGNKPDAIEAAKEYYRKGYKGNEIKVEIMRQVKREKNAGQPLVAVVNYLPSATENLGTYVFFGNSLK